MLVFRRGKWMDIKLPFSDPMLTPAHRQMAAAVAGTEMARGHSSEAAMATAEQVLYETLYKDLRIPREEHHTPKN
jgi:hypothetical protein